MSISSIGSITQPVLETLAELPARHSRAPGPWWVNGDEVCSDEITLRVNGAFESGTERREFLEDLCQRLNVALLSRQPGSVGAGPR